MSVTLAEPIAASTVTLQQETDAQFVSRVSPLLQTLELVREEKYADYCWRRKTAMTIGTLLTPLTGYVDWLLAFADHSSSSSNHGFGVTFIVWGALWSWVVVPKRSYVKSYKASILPQVARFLGLTRYEMDGIIPIGELLNSGILPSHDVYDSEDYFEGNYKGAQLRFAQVTFKRRESDGKRTRYVTVFKGLALMIGLPKPKFYGHTILTANHSGIGSWFESKATGLQRADMVDPVFEKKYDVYTSDQVEARYLIDPAMIERINELEKVYVSTGVSMSYQQGSVFALIACNKDYFEPPDITIAATDIDAMLEIKRELGQVLNLVDYLDIYKPVEKPAA